MRLLAILAALAAAPRQVPPDPPPDTWVKLSPLPGGPVSPRLGYEGDCRWDGARRVMIRYGGHNQGGGGEQHSEIWTFDPFTAKWSLKEPNLSPPGVCCAQQNVFDPVQARYLRFPSFSGSHGWQWFREIYLNNTEAWSYDLGTNRWQNLRPLPAPRVAPLRCASWDSDHQVVVLFGGEGSNEGTIVYDPYVNEWTRMKPPAQPEPRSGGNMAYDAVRKLHILFGAQFTSDPHTWGYDLRKNEWRDLKPATMPHTGPNDAVLSYDAANGVVVALVKITEGKDENARHEIQTWTFNAGKNEWKRANPPREPDPSGNRARQLMYVPELGLTLLESRTDRTREEREQQIWVYRPGAAKSLPGPMALRVTTGGKSARLSWDEEGPVDVLRAAADRPWQAEWTKVASVGKGTSWVDEGLKPGALHFYKLRGTAGRESVVARTQPRIVEDLVVSVLAPKEIEVSWKAREAEDVAGYVVERAVVEPLSEDQLKRLKSQTPPLAEPSVGAVRRVGPFALITAAPLRSPAFTDRGIDLSKPLEAAGEPVYERRLDKETFDESGKPYRHAVHAYRVRAVNALGVESGPSPAVFTIPSAPQWVFSKEEGTTCHIKWSANPEKGIAGYRVYRMDGRFSSAKITRLTEEPVKTLTFSDPGAGKSSRRYYVVAVDALGQEGHPSSPVWFEREWKAFYKPFIGDWHQ